MDIGQEHWENRGNFQSKIYDIGVELFLRAGVHRPGVAWRLGQGDLQAQRIDRAAFVDMIMPMEALDVAACTYFGSVDIGKWAKVADFDNLSSPQQAVGSRVEYERICECPNMEVRSVVDEKGRGVRARNTHPLNARELALAQARALKFPEIEQS